MPSSTPPVLLWDQAYNRNGDGKLPRAAVNVIRTYMDNYTLTGFVKAETLAEATGMTVRGVRKQIAANVAAGWLEIAEPGNSTRATVYRLAYPADREPQFTVTTSETVNHSSPLDAETVNHSSRSTPEGCPTVHGKGEPQFTPTSPRTSPQEKFSTSPRTVNPGSPFGEPDLTDPEGSDETGPEAGSLATAEPMTEATGVAEGSGSDPWGSTPEPAIESRPSGLQSATGSPVAVVRHGCDRNPFCTEPQPCGC